MSETQPEQTTNQSPTVVTSTPVATPTVTTPSATQPVQAKVSGFFNNWKVKAGIIGTILAIFAIGIFTLNFFWAHIIASMGMRDWSKHANAQPIECMIKDTNSDGYVSCSAMLRGEVVPLECGSSVFNLGCRVNYGAAAAPPVRLNTKS
ncbi:hypothetical protein ACE1CI_26810 [Aerosakkonemataceae cyanobacterium BLCC-F50]|uniref:Uncharacterized protein n=1 Tax=Floridaenema flaviceps BLCC-F50 TaxID=3153642 RepID=A0ABV4XYG1_9CYAN